MGLTMKKQAATRAAGAQGVILLSVSFVTAARSRSAVWESHASGKVYIITLL
jgi:hypothetical protein